MMLSKEEYFFYEWVILGKGLTNEELKRMDDKQFLALKEEYREFVGTLN